MWSSSYCCAGRSPNPLPAGMPSTIEEQDLQQDGPATMTIFEEGALNLDGVFDSGMPDGLGVSNRKPEVAIAGFGVLLDATNVQERQKGKASNIKHPSIGSEKHFEGTCKRCCFYPRRRCANGDKCEFCHYDHEKRTHKKRKAKSRLGDAIGDGAEDKENQAAAGKENSSTGLPLTSAPQADTNSSKATSGTSSPTAGYAAKTPQQMGLRHQYQEKSATLNPSTWQAKRAHQAPQPGHCAAKPPADQWMVIEANHPPSGHSVTAWAADSANLTWPTDGQWQSQNSEQAFGAPEWAGAQMVRPMWDPNAQIGNDNPSWWNQNQHSHQQANYGWQSNCQQINEHVVYESAAWPSYTDARVPESQPVMRPLPPGVTVAHDMQPPPMDPTWRAWPHIAKRLQYGMQVAHDSQTTSMVSVDARA